MSNLTPEQTVVTNALRAGFYRSRDGIVADLRDLADAIERADMTHDTQGQPDAAAAAGHIIGKVMSALPNLGLDGLTRVARDYDLFIRRNQPSAPPPLSPPRVTDGRSAATVIPPTTPDGAPDRPAPDRPRPEPDEPILGTEVVRGPLTILDRAVIMVALEYLAEDVDEDPDEFQPEALTWLRSTAAKIRSQPVAVADPIHLEDE